MAPPRGRRVGADEPEAAVEEDPQGLEVDERDLVEEHEGRAARARVLASDELEAGVVEHQVDDDGDGARVQHHHGPGPRALAQAVAHGGPDRPASVPVTNCRSSPSG